MSEKIIIINNKISEAKLKFHEIKHKEKKLEHIAQEIIEVEKERDQMQTVFKKEHRDYEKLIGLTFANFMATLLNTKHEKLRKEEREALRAKKELDLVETKLEKLLERREDLSRVNEEKIFLAEKMNNLIEEKKKHLYSLDGKVVEKISKLENNDSYLSSQLVEINEVMGLIIEVLLDMERVIKHLKSAKGWGLFDMAGGGLLVTMAKRSELNKAQDHVTYLNNTLERLSKELSDITASNQIDIRFDFNLSILDYVFESIFIDWMVQDEITNALKAVSNRKKDVESLKEKLSRLTKEISVEKTRINIEVNSLVEEYIE